MVILRKKEQKMKETIYAVLPHEKNYQFGYIILCPESDDFRDEKIAEIEGPVFRDEYFKRSKYPDDEVFTMRLEETDIEKLKDYPEVSKAINKAKSEGLQIYVQGRIKECQRLMNF